MKICVKDICSFLRENKVEFHYSGNEQAIVTCFAPLKALKENAVTWMKTVNKEGIEEIDKYKNLLLIAPEGFLSKYKMRLNVIECKNPKAVFFKILEYFFKEKEVDTISSTATVLTTNIGKNVSIGNYTFINEEVVIGDNVSIGNNVSIECPVKIGDNSIIHSGVVIGTDGFGYYKEDGIYYKVPHFGGVIIGDRVEIGANTCIDRGTMEDTCIGNDVKIDNLCHIAHNVKIKDRSMVIALSLLGGSVVLEEGVYVAPGALVMNQIQVGEGSLIGMGSVVTKNIEKNKVVVGVPAKVIRENN